MLREERLQIILKMLETNERVSSVALAEMLNVSDDTIRRDLHTLAENGLLQKVHGGAIPRSSGPFKLKERIHIAPDEKRMLAQKAQQYFHDGDVIILDNGTTNMEVARLISPQLKATVVTPSLSIASILCDHAHIDLYFLGGKVFKDAQITTGIEAIKMLDKIRADVCMIGVCAIHPSVGVTIQDWEENQVKSKMVEVSQQVIALVTSDKIDTAEHYVVCPFTRLNVMLTDDQITPSQLIAYQNKGVDIR